MDKLRETRFSDVCGTVDELKRMLHEEPEVGDLATERLVDLVEECAVMLERMDSRLREFQQFRREVVRLTQGMDAIGDSRRPAALQVAWANWRRGYSVLERPEAFDGLGD